MKYLLSDITPEKELELLSDYDAQPIVYINDIDDKVKSGIISLEKHFMTDLGYSRLDAQRAIQWALKLNPMSIEEVLSEIEKGKLFRDSWDPSITYMAHKWRGTNLNLKFLPHLNYDNVTDAYKLFQGNTVVRFIPTLRFPKITDSYSSGSGVNNGKGITNMFSYWSGLPISDLYFDTEKLKEGYSSNYALGIASLSTFSYCGTWHLPVETDLYTFLVSCIFNKTFPDIDAPNVNSAGSFCYNCVFNNCSINLPTLAQNTVEDNDFSYAFENIVGTIPEINIPYAQSLYAAFYNTGTRADGSKYQTTIGDMKFDNATVCMFLFYGASEITSLGNLYTPKNEYAGDTFTGCSKLESIGDISCESIKGLRGFFANTDEDDLTALTQCGKLDKIGLNFSTDIPSSFNHTLDLTKVPNLNQESLIKIASNLGTVPSDITDAILSLTSDQNSKLSSDLITAIEQKNWTISTPTTAASAPSRARSVSTLSINNDTDECPMTKTPDGTHHGEIIIEIE